MESVHDLLLHKSSLLEGLVLRVAGMENLTQNLINLVRKQREKCRFDISQADPGQGI